MIEPLFPIMLSALQHFSYCPRQCALIHQEQIFEDNVFTIRGHLAHERVDSGESGVEYGVRVERALPLFSERYGLVGKGDVVEFLEDGTPYPIEYKQGKRQQKLHDEVQLMAQALCLEEMTGKSIVEGAIFHHKSRRRRVVELTSILRQHTEQLIIQVRQLLLPDCIPPPTTERSLCQNCSLVEACQPDLVASTSTIKRLSTKLFRVEDDEG